jgi:hypothetical protein
MNYLRQKASVWVTFSVLAGGLLSAVILFWVMKVESEIQITSINSSSVTSF